MVPDELAKVMRLLISLLRCDLDMVIAAGRVRFRANCSLGQAYLAFQSSTNLARRPRSVAATAGARMGMRAARRAPQPGFARCRSAEGAPFRRHPGTSANERFAGTPTRSRHARGAVAQGDTRMCHLIGRPTRGHARGGVASGDDNPGARVGWHHALAQG